LHDGSTPQRTAGPENFYFTRQDTRRRCKGSSAFAKNCMALFDLDRSNMTVGKTSNYKTRKEQTE
jgi:hypothetical protein